MVNTLLCVPSKACVGLFDDGNKPTGICTKNTIDKYLPYSALRENRPPVDVFTVLEYYAALISS
jgi:hypothetical protein